jgi:hypothetical protein
MWLLSKFGNGSKKSEGQASFPFPVAGEGKVARKGHNCSDKSSTNSPWEKTILKLISASSGLTFKPELIKR